jgi:hypothetical protein
MSPRVVLSQISPTAWEHPSEKTAYDSVRRRRNRWGQGDPGRKSSEGREKVRQWVLGDAVRVGPAQRPHLYEIFLDVLKTMDLPNENQPMPELYVSARPPMGGGGWGGARPFVLLSARHIDRLEREEQRFIVARAVAQLMSNRVNRRDASYLFDCMDDTAFALFNSFGGGRDMKRWGGASELSDDRGALLATQDLNAALMTLLKLAGGSAKDDSLSVDAWLDQINEAQAARNASAAASAAGDAAGASSTTANVESTSSEPDMSRTGRLARRAIELKKWAESAEYSLILSGAYVRRGQEPVEEPASSAGAGAAGGAWFGGADVKGEAREAVNAVGEVIDKAADTVGNVVNRAADALNDAFSGTGEGSIGDVVNRAKDAFRDAFKAAQSAAKAAEERMDDAWRGTPTSDPLTVDYESPVGDTEGAARSGTTTGTGASGVGNSTDASSGPSAAPI